jgi:hypothetical protein
MRMSLDQLLNAYNQNKDSHRQNWKKIQALHNFAKAKLSAQKPKDIKVWEYLELFIRAYEDRFIWEEEERLLDKILQDYEIDYAKWAVKDAWVKQQLVNGFKCPRGSNQMEFLFLDLDKERIASREKMPLWSKLERYKMIQPRAAR